MDAAFSVVEVFGRVHWNLSADLHCGVQRFGGFEQQP